MGQLNVIDLIVIILLGSSVETAMVAGNVSLPAGLLCTSVLLLLDKGFTTALMRSPRLRALVSGQPVVLVYNGEWVYENLKRKGFTRADVLEALREHEQAGIANLQLVVLEVDGSINVIPMEEDGPGRSHQKLHPRPASEQKPHSQNEKR